MLSKLLHFTRRDGWGGMVALVAVTSTFCPNDDAHHLARVTYLPWTPETRPSDPITYLVTCATCGGPFAVHAEKRWRIAVDPERTLYRSEGDARLAAGDGMSRDNA